jgi:hypothetical protein
MTKISLWKNFHTNTADSAILAMSVAGIEETASMRHKTRIRAWPFLGTKWLKILQWKRRWRIDSGETWVLSQTQKSILVDGQKKTANTRLSPSSVASCPFPVVQWQWQPSLRPSHIFRWGQTETNLSFTFTTFVSPDKLQACIPYMQAYVVWPRLVACCSRRNHIIQLIKRMKVTYILQPYNSCVNGGSSRCVNISFISTFT